MAGHERLQRLLGGAALQSLRQRLRRRYQRGIEGGGMTLSGLSEAERAALSGLLGRRPGAGASMRIDIGDLDVALRRAGLADSLRHALEMLDGAISNLAAARLDAQERWESTRAACGEPRLAALIGEARGLGLLKRLSGADPELAQRLCGAAGRVLSALPARALARSHLAADLLGDAHALDSGRPVGSLVLAALRRGGEPTADAPPEDDEPASAAASGGDIAETAREIWASAGVLVNELARPALFLNLPVQQGAGRLGEPAYLSLRALLRAPPAWAVAGRTVFVCENPNLVAIAADALGTRCAPLVCTDGMPAAAQRTLLTQLKLAGARLRYHGDFDWPGIVIGNVLMRQFGAEPWRFHAVDYHAAVAAATGERRPLGQSRVAALWDAGLGAAMIACDRAIDEEAVAQTLFEDLGDAPPEKALANVPGPLL